MSQLCEYFTILAVANAQQIFEYLLASDFRLEIYRSLAVNHSSIVICLFLLLNDQELYEHCAQMSRFISAQVVFQKRKGEKKGGERMTVLSYPTSGCMTDRMEGSMGRTTHIQDEHCKFELQSGRWKKKPLRLSRVKCCYGIAWTSSFVEKKQIQQDFP